MDYERTWLIACERSGRIRDAMLANGIRAISCDTQPSASEGPHLQCDVREILHLPWGGMVAHPPCTYLANSGSQWILDPGRWDLMIKAAEFYSLFDQAIHIPLRAIENPVMHRWGAELVGHRATQFVQPWMFGSLEQKATGFKLYGLPLLVPEFTKDQFVGVRQTAWGRGESSRREELRSLTDYQIARAVAQYWGPLIEHAYDELRELA